MRVGSESGNDGFGGCTREGSNNLQLPFFDQTLPVDRLYSQAQRRKCCLKKNSPDGANNDRIQVSAVNLSVLER